MSNKRPVRCLRLISARFRSKISVSSVALRSLTFSSNSWSKPRAETTKRVGWRPTVCNFRMTWRELRTLSYLLHPPLLDEAGLASALQWYVSGFSERSKIKVGLMLPEDLPRFQSEIELVIFRVVQECLTNVHRHSGSPTAQINLTYSGNVITLEISDKGKGISPERLWERTAPRAGVGVSGMEERVRQFAGTLQIGSDRDGTKVTVTLPAKSSISS